MHAGSSARTTKHLAQSHRRLHVAGCLHYPCAGSHPYEET